MERREAENAEVEAYCLYAGHTQADGTIRTYWETNDDLDHGYASEFARDTFNFPNKAAFERHCGVSRQGISCKVEVFLDGLEVLAREVEVGSPA